MSPTEEKSDDVDFGDNIDMTTFEQILEMDEPGDCEFSSSIVFGFFDQAEETFDQIQEALEEEDLDKLSSLGHFLKGSSATLGLIKIRDGCEKIQRYGKHEKLDGSPEDDSEVCLTHIKDAFKAVKTDYAEVEKLLRQYYDSRE
ncbi:multistep phosphorelay regulator 1 [Fusarium subglutinans]|uniref:Multistep phosphorelay regulator 1 n=1 Tax=Gibberella subglutinans TaxID=42677 RepID=A0A8H5V4W3_GIBSU|nr:multistep phosphorelay regulator 1 [Fusarium subglutinans]KAF5608885.1 multistep phosphorelay regulator 1 [Fusarium subglutinans]